MMLEQGCDFCAEGSSGQIDRHYTNLIGRSSRILLNLPSLYVIPTLSPIVVNHLLLVPRKHVSAKIQLSGFDKQDFTAAERRIRENLARPGSAVITFEHGIGTGSHGGCGVSHCHIHMLPLDRPVAAKFFELCLNALRGSVATETADLLPGDSYVYIRNDDNTGISQTIVRRGDFPSQFLRNLVEDAMNMRRTNWRELVRSDHMRETLAAPEWM
jgi:diadenosine tetraphosphate (Ap4A) HIT family hydrolase